MMENISVTTTVKEGCIEIVISQRIEKHKWKRLKYLRIDENCDVKVYNATMEGSIVPGRGIADEG